MNLNFFRSSKRDKTTYRSFKGGEINTQDIPRDLLRGQEVVQEGRNFGVRLDRPVRQRYWTNTKNPT